MSNHCIHKTYINPTLDNLVLFTCPKPPKPSTGEGTCCKCGEIFEFREYLVHDYTHGDKCRVDRLVIEYKGMERECPGTIKKLTEEHKYNIEDFKEGNLIYHYLHNVCKILDLNKKETLVKLISLDTKCTFYDLLENLKNNGYVLVKESK